MISQKWFIKISLLINTQYLIQNLVALVDSGADLNCIKERIVPLKFCEKTSQTLSAANNKALTITYKVIDINICQDVVCIPLHFVIVKEISQHGILGTPFLQKLMPIQQINSQGIFTTYKGKNISFQFITDPMIEVLHELKNKILKES